MEIGEPTLLAKLPRAGTSEEGSRRFSQVYGVRDGKTKKRNEVCAAIDGNSLNVFEVINGRNIASWPIPPDAAFISLPYSERQSIDRTTFVRRCWCAVRRKGQAAIHYYEQVKSDGTTRSATSSYPLEQSKSSVIKIEQVNTSERQIVVSQNDGSITCLSSEGGQACRRYQLASGSAILDFHAVQSMSLTDARATVLKGRPDISATLTNNSIIISAVYSDAQDSNTVAKALFFGVWILTTSAAMSDHSSLGPVTVFDLQRTADAASYFKSTGSKLEIQTASSITVFDLTTAAPQKLYERKPFSSDQSSTIELATHISLSYSSGELHLYNPDFNSLLAHVRMVSAPLKRKRDGLGLARMSFIAYFSQLKRVLACSGSQLLAIDIHVQDAAQNPFKQSSLLIGNMLKGQAAQLSIAQAPARVAHDQHLSGLSQELDDLIRSQDGPGFERRLKEAFNLSEWADLKKLNSQQKNFLISKMFTLTVEDGERNLNLTLKILPTQLLKWCIKSGILDDHTVSHALRGHSDLPPGTVSDCFRQADKDLVLLEEYITNAPYIQPAVLTRVIKALIDQALQMPEAPSLHQTTAPSAMDVDERGVTPDFKHTSASANTSSSHAMTCLVHAVKRLAFAGSATVSEQIREVLQQKEVLALIQFLRQQLFLGGYTRLAEVRNYPSPPSSQIDGEDAPLDASPKIRLGSIVTLLNGCIDCLGIVGIIGSNEDQAFIERMIPELCSEIESATAAIEDSTYLQGLLRETLRYAESVERQPFEIRSKAEKSDDARSKKGKIATLYAEGDAADVSSQLPTVLPLSLKAEEDLSKRKVRRGGQAHNRSAREMGMLKDRLKAPYAFERLVL